MPDIVQLATVVLVGALIAAAVMWLAACRAPRACRREASWTWAIAAGILAASGVSDQWPHWPALEDRARFLTLLVPLTVIVETVAATVRSAGLASIVRLGLIAAVAPILLHDTVYLADLNGPNSAEWSPAEATAILCGLTVLLALIWVTICWLQSRTSTPAVLWVLVLDALATAATVMLSGYYRGGLLGLGLVGAITGTTLASYVTQPRLPTSGSVGIGLIGNFSVVLLGRFFGTLSTSLAACLLLAPLLAWIFEHPRLRKLAPPWRSAGRLACVAVPLMVVVVVAQREFTAASTAGSRPFEASVISDRIDE